MRHLAILFALGVALAAPNNTSGLSFAQPGTAALVQLELRPVDGVIFNRLGPSAVRLENPFKPSETLSVGLNGTPWAGDPEHYFGTVKPLEFRLTVPSNTKPGTYPLKLEAELYLCNSAIRVCFRSLFKALAELRVGSSGDSRAAVIEVGLPKPRG